MYSLLHFLYVCRGEVKKGFYYMKVKWLGFFDNNYWIPNGNVSGWFDIWHFVGGIVNAVILKVLHVSNAFIIPLVILGYFFIWEGIGEAVYRCGRTIALCDWEWGDFISDILGAAVALSILAL